MFYKPSMRTLVIQMFILLLLASTIVLQADFAPAMDAAIAFHQHAPVLPAQWDAVSVFRTAPLEVAKVFGRATGCADADASLIESTARAAIDANLDPAIAAATVGIESGCNAFAVSNRGAVGIMQINVHIWRNQFDFADKVNLFNRDDNLRAGAQIEEGLINQYGTAEGLRRYNGTGLDCPSCDPAYANKILALAGRR